MIVWNKKIKIGLFFLLSSTLSYGCCMLPTTYDGAISQKAQEAIIIHDGDKEELILGINYDIKGKTMPKEFAWVITVPNEPDKYSLADKKIFKDMFYLSEKILKPISKGRGFFQSKSIEGLAVDGVELGKRVKIGDYDIQPIRGVGKNALDGLNQWLSMKGFPNEDEAHMKYFIKNNFTFLCIRITPQDKGEVVPSGGLLSPLHLSFKSETLYYPLLFSSRQGVFDINIHVLTKNEFAYAKSVDSLIKINWENKDFKRNVLIKENAMPESLKNIFDNTSWKNNIGQWRYNNFRGYRVNGDHPKINEWKEDIFFKTKSF